MWFILFLAGDSIPWMAPHGHGHGCGLLARVASGQSHRQAADPGGPDSPGGPPQWTVLLNGGVPGDVSAPAAAQADPRVGAAAGNSVRTAKYTLLTFLPVFLFEVFIRVAYLYFLLQASQQSPC